MKKLFFIAAALFSFTAISCKKESIKGNGWVVFSAPPNSHGNINVNINGNISKMGIIVNNPDFDCNIYKGYNGAYLLDVGTYSYSATADDGYKWTGTFEILTDDDCVKRRLQ